MRKPKVLPQRHSKQTPQSGVHCLLPVKFVWHIVLDLDNVHGACCFRTPLLQLAQSSTQRLLL
jgi:hypothetical protein